MFSDAPHIDGKLFLEDLLTHAGDGAVCPLETWKGLDYKLFDSKKGTKILYIAGTNEPKDWLINLCGLLVLPLVHVGYLLMAVKLRKMVKSIFPNDEPFFLAGHSYGGAVVSVYMALFGRKKPNIVRAFTFGAPACLSWLNPIYLTRKKHNFIAYNKPDDFTMGTPLMFFYRFASKPVMLPRTCKGIIKGHSTGEYKVAITIW
jgi:hypothetical protein